MTQPAATAEAPQADEKKEGQETKEPSASITVSLVKPEMALLDAEGVGLLVVAIPLNVPGVNRIVAAGFLSSALHRIHKTYDKAEAVAAQSQKLAKQGDLSLLGKARRSIAFYFKDVLG